MPNESITINEPVDELYGLRRHTSCAIDSVAALSDTGRH
jgi:hypothetical protein